MFEEFYPRGAAAREHGRGAAALYPVYKLGRLLHYREVGGDIHVEALYVAELFYGGDHLALHVCAYGQTERLSQSCAHGGCGVEHHLLFIVYDCAPYVGHGRLFVQRAHGAGDYALAAVYAGSEREGYVVRRADNLCITPVFGAYRAYRLVLARRNAAGAEYALRIVPYHRGREVVYRLNVVVGAVFVLLGVVFEREFLKFAVHRANAGEALLFMGGEDELHRHLSRFSHLGRVGAHLHALGYGIHARRNEPARARRLDEAHAAGADALHVL